MYGILFLVAGAAFIHHVPHGGILLFGGIFSVWIYQVLFEKPINDYEI